MYQGGGGGAGAAPKFSNFSGGVAIKFGEVAFVFQAGSYPGNAGATEQNQPLGKPELLSSYSHRPALQRSKSGFPGPTFAA